MPDVAHRSTEPTGRYLVLLDDDALEDGVQSLADAGVSVARITASEPRGPTEMSANHDGVVFDQLGVAILDAPPAKVDAARAALADTRGASRIEPEYYCYPTGTGDYLRGYRDGVDALVSRLLGSPEAAREPARIDAIPVRAPSEGAFTWGLDATRAAVSSLGGSGVKIAILDTGIDLGHPDFAGRSIVTRSFIDGEDAHDVHGHGTHTAGTACGPRAPSALPRYGVAPDATLYVGKVLSNSGRGPDGAILAGINWALASGCRVISMSLASGIAEPSPIYQAIGLRALARNALIIAASGNDSRRTLGRTEPTKRPANAPSIVSVAAVDASMNVAWFSNGGKVEIAGPGVDVLSAAPRPLAYRRLNGTSMATPHVAGVAALLMQANPSARASEVVSLLKSSARPLGASPADVGSGLVQAPLTMASPASTTPPPSPPPPPAPPPLPPSGTVIDPVLVLVDDAYTDRFAEVVAGLRAAGMTITEEGVKEEIGIIEGTVPHDKRPALAAVPGVTSVSTPRGVQLPPPDSDVQ